jgi:hypothetical protein
MARAWRIEYEGALYHVLSRGNQRQAIFADDEDRQVFLTTLNGTLVQRCIILAADVGQSHFLKRSLCVSVRSRRSESLSAV